MREIQTSNDFVSLVGCGKKKLVKKLKGVESKPIFQLVLFTLEGWGQKEGSAMIPCPWGREG